MSHHTRISTNHLQKLQNGAVENVSCISGSVDNIIATLCQVLLEPCAAGKESQIVELGGVKMINFTSVLMPIYLGKTIGPLWREVDVQYICSGSLLTL
jgi:hypothetical protein